MNPIIKPIAAVYSTADFYFFTNCISHSRVSRRFTITERIPSCIGPDVDFEFLCTPTPLDWSIFDGSATVTPFKLLGNSIKNTPFQWEKLDLVTNGLHRKLAPTSVRSRWLCSLERDALENPRLK